MGEQPSIQLTCGHIVHLKCAKTALETKWSGTHIHFSFRNCPLCQVQMKHDALDGLTVPLDELYEKTLEVGRKTFEDEDNLTDQSIISNPSSEFYQKKDEYILAKMTFFQCYKVIRWFID